MLKIYRVSGDSMLPGLRSGDFVVALTRFYPGLVRRFRGAMLVFRHPDYGVMVKRLTSWQENGTIIVSGDNPDSLSPQQIGAVSYSQLLGLVVWSIRKPSRDDAGSA